VQDAVSYLAVSAMAGNVVDSRHFEETRFFDAVTLPWYMEGAIAIQSVSAPVLPECGLTRHPPSLYVFDIRH
jgi:hypothetical protein